MSTTEQLERNDKPKPNDSEQLEQNDKPKPNDSEQLERNDKPKPNGSEQPEQNATPQQQVIRLSNTNATWKEIMAEKTSISFPNFYMVGGFWMLLFGLSYFFFGFATGLNSFHFDTPVVSYGANWKDSNKNSSTVDIARMLAIMQVALEKIKMGNTGNSTEYLRMLQGAATHFSTHLEKMGDVEPLKNWLDAQILQLESILDDGSAAPEAAPAPAPEAPPAPEPAANQSSVGPSTEHQRSNRKLQYPPPPL